MAWGGFSALLTSKCLELIAAGQGRGGMVVAAFSLYFCS
jgi:hypothetical protein